MQPKLCKRCMQGSILTGEQAKYNAKSKDGQPICPECKLNECYDRMALEI